jgi:CRISPR-associated endonuclease/helicase Cas3
MVSQVYNTISFNVVISVYFVKKGEFAIIMNYLAHSANCHNATHALKDHLSSTSELASEYAMNLGEDFVKLAKFCGYIHDLGKYGDLFQNRLKGIEKGIDHWSAGACVAQQRGLSECAIVIEGHHVGIKSLEPIHLNQLDFRFLLNRHPLDLRLSENNLRALRERLLDDGLRVVVPRCQDVFSNKHIARMLDVRMLYSTLVDADFVDTEKHFSPEEEPRKPISLEPEKALSVLMEHINQKTTRSKSSEHVKMIRNDLLKCCLEASNSSNGVFTLTSPTGTGKTLSMLAFALSHAVKNNLERIIFVIPYLSIIDQTAKIYRDIFENRFGEGYILEHHSLANGAGGNKYENDGEDSHRKSFNWDSPIILTTNVQLLQSLFANRPSPCRKLHRLARSIILFDEAQTMPSPVVIPSLASLSHIAHRYSSTIVFSTATQPAFSHLNNEIIKQCDKGWNPKEIVPDNLRLYERSKRVNVKWPADFDNKTNWNELAEKITNEKQILVILNTKRELGKLYRVLGDSNQDDVFILSTNLAPAHRLLVLDEVRKRLESNQPVKLISTQCVEAGVDIDFPIVLRELAPLDSIAQAAGRCNRNGNLASGTVEVILTEEPGFPNASYRQAIDVAKILLRTNGGSLNIDDPKTYLDYYTKLYDITKCHDWDGLKNSVEVLNFEDVAEKYKVIDQDTINILVPFDPVEFEKLAQEARDNIKKGGITRSWQKRASKHSVSIYRPKPGDQLFNCLEEIKVSGSLCLNEWFIAGSHLEYHQKLGLIMPVFSEKLLIA